MRGPQSQLYVPVEGSGQRLGKFRNFKLAGRVPFPCAMKVREMQRALLDIAQIAQALCLLGTEGYKL